MRKNLLALLIFIFAGCAAFAQKNDGRVVTGKLLDAQSKEPLIGATVVVKGTTKATSVTLDGSFKINIAEGSATLVFTYIGYVPKEMSVTAGQKLGVVTLDPSSSSMREVVVTGDIAIDRKTPVAVTTLNAQMIEEKIGIQDLPSVLRIVPGVMVTNTQGFGDSRVSIRGFSAAANNGNVALTINGIPVNDMETGNNYWSDFTGLSDVTTSMQVQRGLGASKIIVPSFGGTINITTRNTDAVKGGYVFEGVGSDGYNKMGVLISSGLTKNGWSATFQGSKTEGNYHADNTQFLNYNYFFNLSKVLSPSQTLSFSIMGAVQHHNQRYQDTLRIVRDAPQGNRYNVDAGVLNGSAYNPYQNFYSKPIASLNHSWVINEKSSLNTVLYGTYGTGAGVSLSTQAGVYRVNGAAASDRKLPNGLVDYSPLDLTALSKANAASPTGAVTIYDRVAENDHHWFGLRSTYTTQLTNDINLAAGIDLRDYTGTHYQEVYDLFGGGFVQDGKNVNDPTAKARVGDKVGYYNVDNVISGGAYAQAEYSKNDLSAFITLSGSESADRRNDYFIYTPSQGQTSPWVNFFNYQAKGGANYNINDQMNVFANVGYITKPPYFSNVFINNTNSINKNSVAEKLFSYELGYGYKISGFSATVNLYRSNYMDHATTKSVVGPNQVNYSVNLSGLNEMHEGGELELKYKPASIITINGSLSIGNWYYTKNAGPAQAFDDNNQPVGTPIKELKIKGLKIGDAAQTQAHLGVDFDILPELRVGGDYFYNGNYTSSFSYINAINPFTPWKIPSYNLVDLSASFKFKIAGLDASLNGNVYNLLNTFYISDAYDSNATGNPTQILGYYGYGRTFSTSLKIKF